jgi:hypothetical protein
LREARAQAVAVDRFRRRAYTGRIARFQQHYVFLVIGQLLSGITGVIIGVLTVLVVTDLTAGTGRFNLAQGAVGAMSGIAASISTLAPVSCFKELVRRLDSRHHGRRDRRNGPDCDVCFRDQARRLRRMSRLPPPRDVHSTFMLAALMIGHHFSASDF